MTHSIYKSSFATVVLGALILAWPMILNGAPFYFIDSGYYLLHNPQGLDQIHPNAYLWRPLVYSTFLKLPLNYLIPPFIGLHEALLNSLPEYIVKLSDRFVFNIVLVLLSVFFSIFLQCCLVSFSLYRLSQLFQSNLPRAKFLLVLFLLTFVSPIGFYANLVMADLFVALFILISIYLHQNKIQKNNILEYALVIFSVASHYSALLCNAVYSLGLALVRRKLTRSGMISTGIVLLGLLTIAGIHYMATKQLRVSNTAQIYFHSHLTSLQVVQPFLENRCRNVHPEPFKACRFLDASFHIWDLEKGQRVQKMGGLRAMEDDIRRINMSFLTSPYVLLYLQKSLLHSLQQWFTFSKAIDLITEDDYLEKELGLFSRRELKRFQSQRIVPKLKEGVWDQINFFWSLCFVLSLVWALFCYVRRRKHVDGVFTDIIGHFLIFYLCNGLVIGLLTDVHSRYSHRLIWIPVAATMFHILTRGGKTEESPEVITQIRG